ncbi:MAG: hypothetical protein ACK50Z_03530 [Betaproteobacteria bacterium]
MKVSCNDLYTALRTELATVLKELGFTRAKDSRLGWQRSTATGRVAVFFQCNKRGWDESWGSKFTVEFERTDPQARAVERADRIGYLLEGFPELDELRRCNNAVIERLPGTREGKLVATRLPDGTDFVAVGERADPEPAIYGRDLWLVYHSMEDVRQWAAYFKRNLVHFISLFEEGILSEQRRVRMRFEAFASRVRACPDAGEKARMFEEYARSETDPHFAAGAMEWARLLRETTGNAASQGARDSGAPDR